MDTFIVRIYLNEECDAESLTGIVERVGYDYKKVFNTAEELWEILKCPDMGGFVS